MLFGRADCGQGKLKSGVVNLQYQYAIRGEATEQVSPMDRRNFINLSRAFAANCAIGGRFGHASTSYPFALGVASGQPSPDGFVIWTRLAPEPLAEDGLGGMSEPAPVIWEVGADDRMRHVVRTGVAEATGRFAHSVHVEVAGLEPGRPYWYRFAALGEQGPMGTARTLPAADAKPSSLRFTFASCSNWQTGYFSAYRHMAAEHPDLIIFLGDYIYEETLTGARADRAVRKHDGPTAVDLAGYRNRYALYHTDPDLQAIHAAAPCLMTWDDHEVEDDYADKWSELVETSPEVFLRRRAAAYRAYYEHMPLRARSMPQGSASRIYDRFRFGDLATFSVLDGRQYRTKQPCELPRVRRGHIAPDSCEERLDPQRTYLGAEQEQWLFDGFKQSDATWNVIAQEQLVAQFRGKDRDGVWGYWTDAWDGFPAARKRMIETIAASRVANPVFIGGDFHSYWTTDLKADFADPESATVATEFVGTSITSNPPPRDLILEALPENPHVRYFESQYRGYVAVDVSRERMETRFRVISDRRDPNATVSTLEQFVVESGIPGAIAD
jgi:alkaline phosphatase D